MNGLVSKRRRHSLAPEWWRLNTDNNLFMRHLASMSVNPLSPSSTLVTRPLIFVELLLN